MGEFSWTSSFFVDGFVFFLLVLETDLGVEAALELVDITEEVDSS